ncbi:GntR family transcriptional regulator [Paraglaciecola sp. 2405UD69-4]|uniref:GntR family transcriptional regulator n=1 Tax=Paraglaciecola sp. 2405UD69-4 TaxID=3391836 RepID=UPI0039C94339
MSTIKQQTQTTSELIAEQLRNAIIVGDYQSGQALKQDALAKQFEVSKIPVREALYQLKSEGLVTFLNNRGSIVSKLSISEVEQIYTMRLALEEIALKRAIPNFKPANKIAAETALKLIESSDNPLDWAVLNWEFHAGIYRAAAMPKMLETISMLHNNVSRYLLLYLKDMEYNSVSQDEHWELLDACNSGNIQVATQVLKKHLSDALQQTIQFMKQRD